MPAPTFLFAGGGSGGHISPGLAIAERLAEADAGTKVVFACSDRPIDAHMLGRAGACFVPMPAHPPALRPRALVRFARSLARCRRLCRAVIRDHAVGRVVALGGFASVPAALAARRLGVPVTLINLDRPPGRANRWLARRSESVWTAIDLPSNPGFAERVVGMPIRRLALAPGDPATCRSRLGLEPDRPTLLVTGASQGARSINRLVTAMAGADPRSFDGWQILHLAGRGDEEQVRTAYASAGVRALVREFLDEMGLAWGAADLAVSRAGANSVAEARANAVPTLFLPYPHHADQHQRHNARAMVDLGGAVLAEDRVEPEANVREAGRVLRGLLAGDADREAMRRRLRDHRPPDAAGAIATLLLHAAPLR